MLTLQDEERRRIARELHDLTAQNLFALTLDLGRLRQLLAPAIGEDIDVILTESQTLGEYVLRRLSKLTPLDLQRLYASRLAAGLSSTSVHHVHVMLHRALKQPLRWGLVDRNVSEMTDAPRRTLPDVTTWNGSQSAAVLAAGDESDLAALWRLALLCGPRRGELLGLRWEDVDLERGTLSIRRTLSRGKGGTWELGQPKTVSSRRPIVLPASCIAALRRHKANQNSERLRLGAAWEDHGFVFTNGTGGPLHVNSLMARCEKLVVVAGVPRIKFHDMRHTSATLMLENGIHPKILQERLGHADISMTLNRYSPMLPPACSGPPLTCSTRRIDAALRPGERTA